MNLFAPLFSRRMWRHVPLLVVGAILAPGRRMISSVLSTVGLRQEQHFQTYHHVLNRAVWSSLKASRILLHLLVRAWVIIIARVVVVVIVCLVADPQIIAFASTV